jgi:hypothetical protein
MVGKINRPFSIRLDQIESHLIVHEYIDGGVLAVIGLR